MLEGFLRFTIVVEAKFVHGSVADGPGVTDIPLLESFVSDRSKSRHVRAGGLKLRKGRDHVVIVEIIIEAKILPIVYAVIEFYRELITAVRLHRYGLNDVGRSRGNRYILKQIDSGRIHAFQRYQVAWKDVGVVSAVRDRNGMSSNITSGLLAVGSLTNFSSVLLQCVRTAKRPRERRFRGKIGNDVTIHHV